MHPDGTDVVDQVTEIPLPGRAFCPALADRSVRQPVAVAAFVAGPENRLAASAINRLLESADPRAVSCVLSICGASGTGKTHLARGLVRSWQERDGDDCAVFLTAADFRHTLADAIKRGTVNEYRGSLRGRRLVAIDDVDRLPRDAYLQQELRSTIDALESAGAMLIVTSSTPVSAARDLSADVRSRLAGGLELHLAPPDEAARERLAYHVSSVLGRPLSPEAARRLAAGVSGTANELFGALLELRPELSRPIGSDVRAVEKYLASRAARRPALRDILQAVAKYYRIPQKILKSSTRRSSVVAARAMAIYLARELTTQSYEQIGRALGGRDHSTVVHSYRKTANQLVDDDATRSALADLKRELEIAVRAVDNSSLDGRSPTRAEGNSRRPSTNMAIAPNHEQQVNS